MELSILMEAQKGNQQQKELLMNQRRALVARFARKRSFIAGKKMKAFSVTTGSDSPIYYIRQERLCQRIELRNCTLQAFQPGH
jgi:hypothetical protein